MCELDSVSICAAELALRGEAVVSRNKIPSGNSPRAVGCCLGSNWGNHCRKHREEMDDVGSHQNISVLWLRKNVHVMLLPII